MVALFKTHWRTWRWDGIGLGIAGLCLAHCLASAILLGLFAAAGAALLHPAIHAIGLVLATGIGALALGQGIMRHGSRLPLLVGAPGLALMAGAVALGHGWPEILCTMLGLLLLAWAHVLNQRASH